MADEKPLDEGLLKKVQEILRCRRYEPSWAARRGLGGHCTSHAARHYVWPCTEAVEIVRLLEQVREETLMEAAAAMREESRAEYGGRTKDGWEAYLDYYGAANWLEARAVGRSNPEDG